MSTPDDILRDVIVTQYITLHTLYSIHLGLWGADTSNKTRAAIDRQLQHLETLYPTTLRDVMKPDFIIERAKNLPQI